MTPWHAAQQGSLSITSSQRLLKLMSIESVMPSNHLILRCPLLLPPSIFPSIRVFSKELALHIRWSKYWSFSFSNSPSGYSGLAFEGKPSRRLSPGPWAVTTVLLCSGLECSLATYRFCGPEDVYQMRCASLFSLVI